MNNRAGIIVSLLFVAICGLVLWLVFETLDREYVDTPATATPYNESLGKSGNPRDLNEETDILGQAVYDNSGEILGVLYDVYADPETGQIQWLSVNIQNMTTDRPDAELILVTAAQIENLESEEAISLSLSKTDFFELPFQQTEEERLAGLINLRTLPDNTITDASGTEIGTINNVSYTKGYIDLVYFTASMHNEAGFARKSFAIPLRFLRFELPEETFSSNPAIRVTERQAGAINMYLSNPENFE